MRKLGGKGGNLGFPPYPLPSGGNLGFPHSRGRVCEASKGGPWFPALWVSPRGHYEGKGLKGKP